MKVESKQGKLNHPEQKIFEFLANFDNFKSLIPQDKVKDWESTEDSCSFTVDPVGKTGFKIIEKEANNLIKLTSKDDTQHKFTFWIQLNQIEENDTRVKLTMDAALNPMMAVMAKKPLKKFLDTLIDQMGTLNF